MFIPTIVLLTLALLVLLFYRLHRFIQQRRMIRPIVEQLRYLEREGYSYNIGVCQLVSHKTDVRLSDIIPFDKYPNYSGNIVYPIKHPDLNPKNAFHDFHKWHGGYGKERKRFCRWCADYLCDRWKIAED